MTGVMTEDEVVVNLDPGACRFPTKVRGVMVDGVITFHLESNCPYVKRLEKELGPIPMMDIMTMPFCENKVYIISGKVLKHSVCPVPMAILKCGEVVSGLGIKRDIKADFQR